MKSFVILSLGIFSGVLALSRCTTYDTITRTISTGTYVIDYPSTNPERAVDCIMDRGITNNIAVSMLQIAMITCYPSQAGSLTATGDFGPLTESVLKAVQKQVGATVDGIWGPETGDLMRWDAYPKEIGPTKCLLNGL